MPAQAVQLFLIENSDNTWRDEIFKFLNEKLDQIIEQRDMEKMNDSTDKFRFPFGIPVLVCKDLSWNRQLSVYQAALGSFQVVHCKSPQSFHKSSFCYAYS